MLATTTDKNRGHSETTPATSQSTLRYFSTLLAPLRGRDVSVRSLAQRVTHEWTRDEISLVCELLNEGDPAFLNALESEIKMQSGVGRSALGGFQKGASLLTESAAGRLLEMVRNESHRKEVQDLAIAFLCAPELATSISVITQCGETLSPQLSRLDERQWDKVCLRANRYPLQGTQTLSAVEAILEDDQQQPQPRVDVAGAVCVLMLAEVDKNPSSNHHLLEQGLRFAKQHPFAENVWLKPLATHHPEGLEEWKLYVGGSVPFSHYVQAFSKAAVATLLPTGLFMGTGFAAGRPLMLAGPIEPLVLLSIGVYYGSKILNRSLEQIQERVKKFAVDGRQKEQVLACEVEHRQMRKR